MEEQDSLLLQHMMEEEEDGLGEEVLGMPQPLLSPPAPCQERRAEEEGKDVKQHEREGKTVDEEEDEEEAAKEEEEKEVAVVMKGVKCDDYEGASEVYGTREDADDNDGADDDDQHIKVVCRIRPGIAAEKQSALGVRACIKATSATTLELQCSPKARTFTFDHVAAADATQEDMFHTVAKPISQACLHGYNGTIFCYGQTGSGKTYTTFGPQQQLGSGADSAASQRGIVPRVLDYLFSHIRREERRRTNTSNGCSVQYLVHCGFYEIYSERVFDLLDASSPVLQVREDMRQGVYVDGLTTETITCPEEACACLQRGYRNRHVGETAMNRESSRSHAVFFLKLDSREETPDGLKKSRTACFNLVDLAGSERHRDTHASGERLKEAGTINKSLSALGNVINALVENGNGKQRHVAYRDSKLTFLLRDSLGGNSKTLLIATVSPAERNYGETLSTLKFAQRAKMIRNAAVLNEETSGKIEAMQIEIQRLRHLLCTQNSRSRGSNASAFTGTPQSPPVTFAAGTSAGTDEPDVDAALSLWRRRPLVPTSPASFAGEGAQAAVVRMPPENLLADAVRRCLIAAQERDQVGREAAALQQRLDAMQRTFMSQKMQLKFRDAELIRYRKKTAQQQVAQDPQGSDSDLAAWHAERDNLLQDFETERAAMNAELVTYRLACEEAEARLVAQIRSSDAGLSITLPDDVESKVGQGDLVWSLSQETEFQDHVQAALESMLAVKDELQREMEQVRSDRFVEATGISLEEAKQLREENGEIRALIEAKEEVMQQKRLALAEKEKECANLLQSTATLERKLAQAERQLEHMESARLEEQKELNERISSLEGENAQHQGNDAIISEYKQQIALCKKDNVVLLERLRELDTYAEERDQAVTQLTSDLAEARQEADSVREELAEKLAAAQEAAAAAQTAVQQRADTLQGEVKEMRESLSRAEEDKATIATQHEHALAMLEDANQELESKNDKLTREKDHAVFELESMQEDYDTTEEMNHRLVDQVKLLENAVVQAKEMAKQWEAKCEEGETECAALSVSCARLQDELHQAANTSELRQQERTQLLADIETAKAESQAQVAELEGTTMELRAEVQTARRAHAEQTAELEELQIKLAAFDDMAKEVHTLRDQLRRTKTEAESTWQELQETQADLRLSREAEMIMMQRAEDLQNDLVDVQHEMASMGQQVEDSQQASLDAAEELRASSAMQETLRQQVADLEEQIDCMRLKQLRLQEQVEEVTNQRDTVTDRLSALRVFLRRMPTCVASPSSSEQEMQPGTPGAHSAVASSPKPGIVSPEAGAQHDPDISAPTAGINSSTPIIAHPEGDSLSSPMESHSAHPSHSSDLRRSLSLNTSTTTMRAMGANQAPPTPLTPMSAAEATQRELLEHLEKTHRRERERARAETASQVAGLREQNAKLNERLAALHAEREHAAKETVQLQDRLVDAEYRANDTVSLRNSLSGMEARLKQVESLYAQARESIVEKNDLLKAARAQEEDLESELSQLRGQVMRMQARDDTLLAERAQIGAEVERLRQLEEETCRELESHLQAANDARAAGARLQSELEQAQETIRKLQEDNADLVGHQNSKQKIQAHMRLKEQINNLQTRNKELSDRIQELELQLQQGSSTGRLSTASNASTAGGDTAGPVMNNGNATNLAATSTHADSAPPSSQGRPGRWRNPRPRSGSDSGERIVGRRIKLWSRAKLKFFEGVIRSFNGDTEEHQIEYTCNTEELAEFHGGMAPQYISVLLSHHRWLLCEERSNTGVLGNRVHCENQQVVASAPSLSGLAKPAIGAGISSTESTTSAGSRGVQPVLAADAENAPR